MILRFFISCFFVIKLCQCASATAQRENSVREKQKDGYLEIKTLEENNLTQTAQASKYKLGV